MRCRIIISRMGCYDAPSKETINSRGKTMPAKKTSPTNSTVKKNTADRKKVQTAKPSDKKTADTSKKTERDSARRGDPTRIVHQVMPFVLIICAIFLLISYIVSDAESTGFFGGLLKKIFFGFFAGGAWAIPFAVLNLAIFYRKDLEKGFLGCKITFTAAFVSSLSVLINAFARHGGSVPETFNLIELFKLGCAVDGGGIVGGIIGNLILMGFGFVGTVIFTIALMLLFATFMFGLTPHMLIVYIVTAIRKWRDGLSDKMEEQRTESEQVLAAYENKRTVKAQTPTPAQKKTARGVIETLDNESEKPFFDAGKDDRTYGVEDEEEIPQTAAKEADTKTASDDGSVSFEVESTDRRRGTLRREKLAPVPKTGTAELNEVYENEGIDLAKIFKEPDESELALEGAVPEGDIFDAAELDLTVEKGQLTNEVLDLEPVSSGDIADDGDDGEPPFEMDENTRFITQGSGSSAYEQAVIDYAFPPISLLKQDRQTKSADISTEIQQTANKLVETLKSFNVKTKIINVSRGPTVTRYELQPEIGTKVRSIVNLVDDIALHLATSGVRIEAPIPGKEAVGIEVPNRTTSTVYIRELLEDEAFKSNKSKVVTALGMDVAGAPVFLDVAKMPHLLIAGTTGSGKSVCINSLIVSMLYKARPDEVKFIMVDPKKVELNVYNGIPHLLVPVVSDPKKAAGSLHWAVTEMERRYELIEGAGVRNIKGYNDSIANDPDAEKLPQIVIIIDELADLMMMARDDVEEAICRIAQKARAAGMHLVLGTQRPTVDVVTGLIKANVPSRIAFTTFSQMDSRTIIDTIGAEKLIGRGDMLYAPIGSVKPTRVQGCFVSDEEVEEVTTFIKNNYGVREYDKSVMETIEREAQLCGNKKATVLGDGDEEANDGDPMLKPAIQLAVESGKISTSLIQRKLQLGYGRAAKLIDSMEQMGIVSPPQGQKPRDVLISKSEWMEMELRRED